MADQLNGNGKRGIDEIHEESTDPTGSAVVSELADDGVTMLDVLQDEQELEEDANAVLGAGDDKNCSYDQGYVKRQALYACTTCSVPSSPDFKPAGICLACSYHCHDGHEMVELYTKRNFKCDCGTPRSGLTACKLRPGKIENENVYNQNYSGTYCSCCRPYPDPQDPIQDQMIQCIVCEDWYHGRHLGLGAGPPEDSSYAEMICLHCVAKYPILNHYQGLQNTGGARDKDESVNVNVVDVEVNKTVDSSTPDSLEPVCKLPTNNPELTGTMFLPENWRSSLCQCSSCVLQYTQHNISFLLDNTDTVHYYESQGLSEKGQFEQGMEVLSQMDRVKQVQAISMYNNMKTDLMGFLADFAREGKVVKQEDIQNFFQEMKSKKRPKLDLPPPDTCK
ncbi:putative E3 ubiquitin-protein ligase UBR7 [Eurytemora carolleeae]|uniref:putative E3 ubiquitin-protein ligase UBR7 n=1 Tax=Eurytemora carolleeae TaxID=1294199 RepID=UPI000C77F90F|nr:putative E3 ubiquitin-protein ligase UBR7 [Eurytemora carolleeae]|eukprot:XP_023334766.1 putative E3 ubiquitin-protein ligase UBR7 [Eurytemora affinis]